MTDNVNLKQFVGHRIREIASHIEIFRSSRESRLLMIPTYGRVQSSLLRVYNLAPELRGFGWTPLIMPHQLEINQRSRIIRHFKPDLIFLQKSRHPLNDPSLFHGVPFIYDIDDADFVDLDLAPRIEKTCRSACAVIAGSRYVADWCKQFNENTHVVWTGAPASKISRRPHEEREPILTWAQSDPNSYPAEFDFVEDIVTRLAAEGVKFKFRLYGWRRDSPSDRIDRMERLGVDVEVKYLMKYDKFLESLNEVAVGMSPIVTSSRFSRGKSFGKILAYLDMMVPCVISAEADHSDFFTSESGVCSNDRDVWIREIRDLLENARRRDVMAKAAFSQFKEKMSVESVSRALSNIMRSCDS